MCMLTFWEGFICGALVGLVFDCLTLFIVWAIVKGGGENGN